MSLASAVASQHGLMSGWAGEGWAMSIIFARNL